VAVAADRKLLVSLDLSANQELIANLAFPSDSDGDPFDLSLLGHLREMWVSLTKGNDITYQLVDGVDAQNGDVDYWRMFGNLGAYYSFFACRAAAHNPMRFFSWMSSEKFASPEQLGEQEQDMIGRVSSLLLDPSIDAQTRQERILGLKVKMNRGFAIANAFVYILAFDQVLLSLVVTHSLLKLEEYDPSLERTVEPEADTFQHLKDFHTQLSDSSGALRDRLDYLLDRLLEYGEQLYREQNSQWSTKHVESAFSEPWLNELIQLGERNSSISKKYGEKKVEKRFEHNIALLFQTFGFVTIPALSGEPAADLLCIGKDAGQNFAFLVDSKSSRRPYALPKTDQRAIHSYVKETVRSIGELHELKFVMLIGNGPANTVLKKLGSLEKEIGTPVRFADVADLVELRKAHSGALRMDFFLDTVIHSECVLSKATFEKLQQKHLDFENTYAQFVRKMRSLTTP
jgi:hypothetical protein